MPAAGSSPTPADLETGSKAPLLIKPLHINSPSCCGSSNNDDGSPTAKSKQQQKQHSGTDRLFWRRLLGFAAVVFLVLLIIWWYEIKTEFPEVPSSEDFQPNMFPDVLTGPDTPPPAAGRFQRLIGLLRPRPQVE